MKDNKEVKSKELRPDKCVVPCNECFMVSKAKLIVNSHPEDSTRAFAQAVINVFGANDETS